LEVHANSDNLLGYTDTRTQSHFIDYKTKKINTLAHVRYYEGMVNSDDPYPNARHLHGALGNPLPAESIDAQIPTYLDLVAMSSPFKHLTPLSLNVLLNDTCLGFMFGVCAAHSRALIVDIQRDSKER
jgi:hypothetical protein